MLNNAKLFDAGWKTAQARLMLSARQAQICRLILAGRADKQIAAALKIAVPTVRTHLGRVFEKLNVGDRSELLLRLFQELCAHCEKSQSPAAPGAFQRE